MLVSPGVLGKRLRNTEILRILPGSYWTTGISRSYLTSSVRDQTLTPTEKNETGLKKAGEQREREGGGGG